MTKQFATDSAISDGTTNVLDKFHIFVDDPLFARKNAVDTDAFNHEAFAETILKLILQNKPPLSIGLFGSWGIGKSTIVNILRRKIEEKHSTELKDIYFNAWKYSGDSFRRQFLIEVAQQIYGDDHADVRRIQQLNYSEVLKKSHQKNLIESIRIALKDARSIKFAFRGSAVARLIISCLSILACLALGDLVSKWSLTFAGLSLSLSISAVFVWFSGMKFDEVFLLHEEPVYDPKLIFPEQFEAEFKLLAQSSELKGRKLVVAIDDLDRCEPSVIRDILISAKNFIGHENCFFIVPCDERAVVDIFSEPSQKEGYRDESLRKYFNVALRIPPITSTDIVDFANTVARQTGIGDEIVQLAAVANCRDARKMKYFLNSFEMKYQVAKAREAAGLMPKIVNDNLPELAKVALIENAYPQLFGKLVENPHIFADLERAILGGDLSPELALHGVSDWANSFPGLEEIVKRTRDIKMLHADVFFPLKSTNTTETRVARGSELNTAIAIADTRVIEEIVALADGSDARVAVADLICDLLERSKGLFLRNTITAAIDLYSQDSFFGHHDKIRVGRKLLHALMYRDVMGILLCEPEKLLRCAQEAEGDFLKEILDHYHKALSTLSENQMPDNLGAIARALLRYSPEPSRFSGLLNKKLEAWSDSSDGLAVIDGLLDLPRASESEAVPNSALLKRIVSKLGDGTDGVGKNDIIRRKLIYADWSADIGNIVPFLTPS
jgi:hypothetical protein